jgi:hypothetical protein
VRRAASAVRRRITGREADKPVSAPKGAPLPHPSTFWLNHAVCGYPEGRARRGCDSRPSIATCRRSSCPVGAVLPSLQERQKRQGTRAHGCPQRARIMDPSQFFPANQPFLGGQE